MSGEVSIESPFHLEPDRPSFEALSHSNGFRFWWGSELAKLLGCESLNSFRKVIERAMMSLTSLGIPVFENIVQEPREVEGRQVVDYKLSRFACYLTAMNGDPKKPQVAQAQAYFVQWAEACRLFLEQTDGVERVAIRAEISEHERTLSVTAKAASVVAYPLFQNAGYRGLYNMDLWQNIQALANIKGALIHANPVAAGFAKYAAPGGGAGSRPWRHSCRASR